MFLHYIRKLSSLLGLMAKIKWRKQSICRVREGEKIEKFSLSKMVHIVV